MFYVYLLYPRSAYKAVPLTASGGWHRQSALEPETMAREGLHNTRSGEC